MLDPAYIPPPRVRVPQPASPAESAAATADRATDADGVHWACQRCTNCCRWPGEVRLLPDEPARIAAYLGMDEQAFIDEFTQVRTDRRGLCLTNEPDGACTMLVGRDCRIQGAKPHQCSGFPNTWNFPGWQEVCEAVPMKLTAGGEWVRL